MIAADSPIWMPPAPAIIRPATKDILKYGGMFMPGLGVRALLVVTALAFVNSALSASNVITIPANALPGDLAVLVDAGNSPSTPADVVPTNWTGINTATGSGFDRIRNSYKVLVSGDPGASVTGINASSDNKVMLVFRPNARILSVAASTWGGQSTSGDPTLQTVSASGQATPLVVIGASFANSGTGAFNTASPAFDATVATANADLLVGYKIYNGAPANHSIDMADLGSNNILASGYLLCR